MFKAMKNRGVLVVLAASLSVLVLAACGTVAESAATAPAKTAEKIEGAPVGAEVDKEGYEITWPETAAKGRVVAYLPTWGEPLAVLDRTRLDRIDYLCVSFANPDDKGVLRYELTDEQVKTIVERTHKAGAKVLVSIGGGSGPEYKRWVADDQRRAFVAGILSHIETFGFDGIDVDIEMERLVECGPDYEKFVVELKQGLAPKGKLVTAALGSSYIGQHVSDTALAQFDFINVMAYDNYWGSAGKPHSEFDFMTDLAYYWNVDRGVAADKVVLGVPFYGYRVKVGGDYLLWKDIVAKWPDAWNSDEIDDVTYNGAQTIADKTRFARYFGGVMIWSIDGDAEGDLSLLRVIKANQQ